MFSSPGLVGKWQEGGGGAGQCQHHPPHLGDDRDDQDDDNHDEDDYGDQDNHDHQNEDDHDEAGDNDDGDDNHDEDDYDEQDNHDDQNEDDHDEAGDEEDQPGGGEGSREGEGGKTYEGAKLQKGKKENKHDDVLNKKRGGGNFYLSDLILGLILKLHLFGTVQRSLSMGSPLTQMGRKAAAQPHSPPLPTLVSQLLMSFKVFTLKYTGEHFYSFMNISSSTVSQSTFLVHTHLHRLLAVW